MLIGAHHEGRSGALPWPAALIVWGPGSVSSLHAHHCIQLVLALKGELQARGGARSLWQRCGAVLVPSDTEHEIDASAASVLIAFIDPESELAAALADRTGTRVAPVPDGDVWQWRRALGEPATLDPERVEQWVRSILPRGAGWRRIHPRVRRVLRALRDRPLDASTLSLRGCAQLAGLSESRFVHVFTQSVGIPLRPYLLWLRLQRAAAVLATGRTVTESAYAAGFSDTAHLTRTFRRMLGVTPRELSRRALMTRELRLSAD